MRPPFGANLNALPSRFITTRCSFSGSTAATHGLVGVHLESNASLGGEHGEVRREETDQRGDIGVRQLDFQLARLDPRHVEQIVYVLEQHARVARDDLRRPRAARARLIVPSIVDQALRRPEDQRERRPQLVADVGEELRLDLVELADALEQPLQLDVLLRDLALLRLLLGDVAPFGRR